MPFNQKPQKFNAKINPVTIGSGDKMCIRDSNPWAGMGFACGVIIKNEKNIHESFLYH